MRVPRRYRRNPLTAGRVIDGHAFVVTPDNSKLHSLNETATALWQGAIAPLDLDGAAAILVAGFEVDAATARADVATCLDDLVARLILVCDES